MKTDKKVLKIAGIVGAGVLLAGAGACVGSQAFPKEVIVEHTNTVTEYKNVSVEVPVEKIVYQDKIIKVDNGNFDVAMKFIQDNIDEDITVEYLTFEIDARNQSENYIRHNIIELLDDNDYFDNGKVFGDYRKSEVSIKSIEEPEVLNADYEDMDLELKYHVVIKAKEDRTDSERVYEEFDITVPFDHKELQDEDIEIEHVE